MSVAAATAAEPQTKEYSPEETVKELEVSVRDVLSSVSAYLKSELGGTCDDLGLLRELNEAALAKYSAMAGTASQLVAFMGALQDNYKTLEPYLSKIDEVDSALGDLEQSVASLDEYTRRLETRVRKISRELRQSASLSSSSSSPSKT